MDLLIDTHVFLWWNAGAAKLNATVRAAIRVCLETWLEWSDGAVFRAPERSGHLGREHRMRRNAVPDGRSRRVSRQTLSDPGNRVCVSAASVWEIAIKAAKGRLGMSGRPAGAIVRNGFTPLPIPPLHAEMAGFLVWDHRDPFDRMLVAQAAAGGLTLVHADETIRQYGGVPQTWAT